MRAFKYSLLFLLPFFFAFFLWSIADMFLMHSPKIFIPTKHYKKFLYISLERLFYNSAVSHNIYTNIQTLNGVKLKGIYKNNNKGFVIIQKGKNTYFIDLNKYFEGYKLIQINPQSAIFEKNGKKYKIGFEKIKSYIKTSNPNTPIVVSKKLFEEYKNNLAKVWQNIGIIQTKEGYKITYIKPGSIFQKLGLKKGDIILEVNGIPLNNDADAWRAYNTINKYKEIKIIIKRNFNIKVLRYEMD